MSRRMVAGISLFVLVGLATVVSLFPVAEQASAHCQVPCGIYDDQARLQRMKEDATTIAKAIAQMNQMASAHDARSLNQMTRWVSTKEEHASHIIEVVSQYFLTQKVKPVAAGSPGYEAYLKKLADHHAVMVAAMKTKQDAQLATVSQLTAAIDTLAAHY